jgi:hypothetical protein
MEDGDSGRISGRNTEFLFSPRSPDRLHGSTTTWDRKSDHPPLSSTEVKNKWSHTSVSSTDLITFHLNTKRHNLTCSNKLSGNGASLMEFNRFNDNDRSVSETSGTVCPGHSVATQKPVNLSNTALRTSDLTRTPLHSVCPRKLVTRVDRKSCCLWDGSSGAVICCFMLQLWLWHCTSRRCPSEQSDKAGSR